MSRCIREREIFALLDRSLRPSSAKRWNEHLAGCAACTARVEQIKRLQSAAREALPRLEPDWSKIDPAIERAIAEVTSRRQPGLVWAPLGLATAAAALVVLALLVSRPGDQPAQDRDDELELAAAPRPATRFTPPEQLECRVLDRACRTGAPAVDQTLSAGDEIATAAGDDVRIAVGPEVTVDVYPGSRMELISAAADTPWIGLTQGTLLVDVPAGALERELMVLAGDTVFTVLDGSFELSVTEDGLIVAVADGELLIDNDDEPTVLAAGVWQTDHSAGADADDWLKLKLAPLAAADAGIESEGVNEREWYRPTGTLPKRVVRDTLNRAKPDLKACYEMALKRFPELEVSVTARVSVSLRGHVSRVRLKGGERWPNLERCISSVLGQMSFPPPTGGPVDLIFPLRLSPER
jgi:ferric-dicitrate binding protein FerR (iron transport regulator)